MPAGEFKARCWSVMDDVNAKGEPALSTKRGTPVAKVVPDASRKQSLFGFMAGESKIVGDIESAVVRLEQWEAIPTLHA